MKKRNGYAVITGASSGIGEAFARQLAAEGYSLILTARRTNPMELLAAELKEKYHTADIRILSADLDREEEAKRLMDEIGELPIAIFINNAGFGDAGHFPEENLEKEISMIHVNVTAMHILTKLVIRKMEKQKSGYLLNVGSSAGLLPAGPYMATYYATKAYVTSLTRAVAQELKEQNSPVYIGCLCPGPVDTGFNAAANVKFALKGITADRCVRDAIRGMKRRQVVIIPTLRMQLACTFGRFLPQSILIGMTGRQQKKKIYRR